MKECTDVQSTSKSGTEFSAERSNISDQLRSNEKEIRQWQQSRVAAGRAMRRISEEKQYRERGYSTIEEYSEKHFDIGESRWHQLVRHAKTYDIIDKHLEGEKPMPQNEAQTRPLQPYQDSPKLLAEVWKMVTDRYGENLSQKKVESALKEVKAGQRTEEDPSRKLKDSIDVSPAGDETPSSNLDIAETGGETNQVPSESSDGAARCDPEGIEDSTGGSSKPQEKNSDEKPRDLNVEGAHVKLSSQEDDGLGADELGLENVENCVQTAFNSTLIDRKVLGKTKLNSLVEKSNTIENGLADSSREGKIASAIWRPVVPSLTRFSAALPDEEDPEAAIFKPREIGRLSSRRAEYETDRVLVCPGIDLFAPVVPDEFIEVVIRSLKQTALTPILYTRHLGRTEDFGVPQDAVVGTPAGVDNIEKKTSTLKNVGTSRRWILFDVDRRDFGTLSSLPQNLDWVVYDPPGGAGVSLNFDEIKTLIEAAQESEVSWTFRRPFKTFGESSFPW